MKHTIIATALTLLALGAHSQSTGYSATQWQWGGIDESTSYHFAVGSLIGLGGQALNKPLNRVLVGWSLGTLAGWAKEMQDKRRGGGVACQSGLLATSAGALTSALLVETIRRQWPKLQAIKRRRQATQAKCKM